jgi:hypothetical protein
VQSRWWKIIAGVVAAVVLLAAVAFVATAPYRWPRAGRAEVTVNGQPSPGSAVYRRGDDVLLSLREGDGEEQYLIRIPQKRVISLKPGTFSYVSGFAFSRHKHPTGTRLGGPKAKADPHLVLTPDSVEFTDLAHRRIHVGL